MNLYDISHEFNAFEDLLFMDSGEVSDELVELEEMVNALLTTKADGMVSFIQKLEDECDLADAHLKRIQAYKKARTNAIERLKTYTKRCMEKIGTEKINGSMTSIVLPKAQKVVDITNENSVPPEFTKVSVTLDKVMIKNALKEGLEVEGARLIDGARNVQFKMKAAK
jgi:hypothetical protein